MDDVELLQQADQYMKKNRHRLWPLRLFYGRINRTELLLGLLFTVFFQIVIHLYPSRFDYLFILLNVFFFFSLVARRISDLGIQQNNFLYLAYLLFPGFLIYLLVWPGQNFINEDGYPPKPFNGSLKKLFGIY